MPNKSSDMYTRFTKCHVSRRKGYRTDATVSVLLGFLLFLIPARKPWPSAFSSESKGQIPRCPQQGRSTLQCSREHSLSRLLL